MWSVLLLSALLVTTCAAVRKQNIGLNTNQDASKQALCNIVQGHGPKLDITLASNMLESQSCKSMCMAKKFELFSHELPAMFDARFAGEPRKCHCFLKGSDVPLVRLSGLIRTQEKCSSKAADCWETIENVINSGLRGKDRAEFGNLGDFQLNTCEDCQEGQPCESSIAGLSDVMADGAQRMLEESGSGIKGERVRKWIQMFLTPSFEMAGAKSPATGEEGEHPDSGEGDLADVGEMDIDEEALERDLQMLYGKARAKPLSDIRAKIPEIPEAVWRSALAKEGHSPEDKVSLDEFWDILDIILPPVLA